MIQKGLFLVGFVTGGVYFAGPCQGAPPKPASREETAEPRPVAKPKEDVNRMRLKRAVLLTESKGQLWVIGDLHLKRRAYGPLQIRQPLVDDLNESFASEIKQRWGKKTLRSRDFLGNLEMSHWAFDRYCDLYATRARLGRSVTDEDRARIWNGGPNGWKNRSTVKYWRKVQANMSR